jgi:hypothetical protein
LEEGVVIRINEAKGSPYREKNLEHRKCNDISSADENK